MARGIRAFAAWLVVASSGCGADAGVEPAPDLSVAADLASARDLAERSELSGLDASSASGDAAPLDDLASDDAPHPADLALPPDQAAPPDLTFAPDLEVLSDDLAVPADLQVPDMAMADMAMVDLATADLAMADLGTADLATADLAAADLGTADLATADLAGQGCVNLACKQVQCPMGRTTSISGTVYAPNGLHPLPNVNVYVPNAAVAPLGSGATCDGCTSALSGSPLVRTRSDVNGRFLLANMPVDANVPVVIQLGKWRRLITVSTVACTNTAVPAGLTHLPRNKGEGNIPKIALVTGSADALECLLRKVGIDDNEFTNPNGNGRVNLYWSDVNGGGTRRYSQALGGSNFPDATQLWNQLDPDLARNPPIYGLRPYDLVLLACEGAESIGNKNNGALTAVQQYVNVGGRVLGEHYHYTWMRRGGQVPPSNQAWSAMVTWNLNFVALPNPTQETVLTSFPNALTMNQWMQSPAISAATVVPPNPAPSRFPVNQSRNTIRVIHAVNDIRLWIQTVNNAVPQHFTFEAPVGAPACGLFAFTDIHVASGDAPGANFPNECNTPKNSLSPQETALEYALFDAVSPVCGGAPPP